MRSGNWVFASLVKSMHGAVNGGWESFEGLALGNESLSVLERVVVKLLAFLLELVHQVSVALEVGWENLSTILDGLHVCWESLLEDLVNLHSVGDLVSKSLVVFGCWISHYIVVSIMELNISGINSKLILSDG